MESSSRRDSDTGPHAAAISSPPAQIGRFSVLSQLGAGGMGVVYAAYDPELDRKVAVKLLHSHLAGSGVDPRVRLLREAQALARLSHPNVVAVYDVGTFEDQVFIAMEFIRGAPLGAWLRARRRDVGEILAVFRDAGRGLAAAHREGLVHGDFKPDNVLIDADGRARVVDFGLAFPQDPSELAALSDDQARSHSGRLRGTPAYLAPEQFRGGPGSARADQWSFCVSLHEALYGRRPFHGDDLTSLARAVCLGVVPPEPRDQRLPTWLRRILLRGLDLDPARRFPAMDDLLAALGRDPTRRRRRALAGAALALALVGAALLYRSALVRAYEERQGLCAAAADKLAGVWDPVQKDRVRAALLATAVPYAADTAERVAAGLDDHAAAWVQMHTEACQATHLRGEQSPALLDLRMACLQRRLTEVRTLVDVLADADAGVVERAAEAVARLPALGPCADAAALLAGERGRRPEQSAAVAAVRERLDQARALETLARYPAATQLVDAAELDARGLDDRTLAAEIRLARGRLWTAAGDPAGERALGDAFYTAASTHADATTVRAAIHLAHAAVDRGDLVGAEPWLRHAQALLARLRDDQTDTRPLEVDLLNTRGTRQVHAGDLSAAEADYRRALALFKELDDPLGAAKIHNNLGNLLVRRGQFAAATRELKQAAALNRELLGPRHPQVGIAINNLGVGLLRNGEWLAARKVYEEARAILVDALGPDHPNVGVAENNLGDVALRLRELVPAADRYTRARQILARAYGDDAAPLSYPLTGLGECLLAQHRLDEARAMLERALALRDPGSGTDLARTRFALALALAADPAERARALALAAQARDGYRDAGAAYARELAEVETWLRERPPA